jgi:D-apionolactonase
MTDTTPLRAGPLSLVFENGDLRYVKLGPQLVLLRLYWAVRDQNWGTVTPELSDIKIDARDDAFDIRYTARCRKPALGIDYHINATIAGRADGSLRFDFDGKALSDFKRNRIGFCVLHPAAQAGLRCEIEHVDGTQQTALLPRWIQGRQPLSPFESLRGLTVRLKGGASAAMRFEGDVFEMEDQRNWTDASFKTFCTPLAVPYPVLVHAGDTVKQSVTLTMSGVRPTRKRAARSAPGTTIEVTETALPLPVIGLGQTWDGAALRPAQIDQLALLRINHLRVDLHPGQTGFAATLTRAVKDSAALRVPLEAALFVDPDNASEQLAAVRAQVDTHRAKIAHWLLYPAVESMTATPAVHTLLHAARLALSRPGKRTTFVNGTDADYVFASKHAKDWRRIEAFCTSTNPQTHAFDDASLVESLEAQATLVRSATRMAGNAPVFVTPVTLKPRYNPYVAGALIRGEPLADARQATLFGAAWTLGSLKYLTEGGATSATYFETVGPRGVLGHPLFHMLADIGGFRGGVMLRTHTSDPLAVDGFALRKGRRLRILLANMTAQPQALSLRGGPAQAMLKLLDDRALARATKKPDAWRGEPGVPFNETNMTLPPHAVARLDV